MRSLSFPFLPWRLLSMSTATQSVTGTHYEQLMKGVDSEVRDKVEDFIRFFANDADTSALAEKSRSDKLRNAYNALVDYIVSNLLNNLNPEQSTFLCTG